MNNRWKPRLLMLMILLLTGCDPIPEERSYALPDGEMLVSVPSESNHYRWPVVGDNWQATKPTDFAFLRNLKPGSIGEIASRLHLQNQARLDEAKTQEKPAPWMVASTELTGELATTMRLMLDEHDGRPQLRFNIPIPDHITKPSVWLDLTARHLVLAGENGIWISRLPWRPWWALPGMPAVELDEPGDAKDFKPVSIKPLESAPITQLGFFGSDEKGADSRCLVAIGRQLFLIDCVKATVLATSTFDEKILHLSVASETGDAAVVDRSGHLFWVDSQLQRVTEVGEVDLELPMPVISPEAVRIAAYHDKSKGRVYKIEDGVVTDSFYVAHQDPGEPMMIRSSRAYDLWIEKNAVHKRPNYPNEAGGDRRSWRTTHYWDIENMIDVHNFPNRCSQLCIAVRPTRKGGKERVLYDTVIGKRSFYRTFPLAGFGDRTLVTAASGNVIAFHDGKSIDLYTRCVNATTGITLFGRMIGSLAWNGQFEELEQLHTLIRAFPEHRFNRTAEQIYLNFSSSVGNHWWGAEYAMTDDSTSQTDRDLAKERFSKFEEWAKSKSPLSLVAKIRYCRSKAYAARGTGWSSSVTQKGWQIFEQENQKSLQAWSDLNKTDDIPGAAYAEFIDLARDTSLEFNDTEPQVRQFLERYPHDDMMHRHMMEWRLERWGGSRGSGPAYAAGVAKAIGPPMGDFIYFRCIESVSPYFPFPYFEYSHADPNRILAGVQQGLDIAYFQEYSALSAIHLLANSHSRNNTPGPNSSYTKKAIRLCEALADHYKTKYPMLTEYGTQHEKYGQVRTFLPE